MRIIDTGELKGITVEDDPERSGEVLVDSRSLTKGKFVRVIPDPIMRDIYFIASLSGYSDRFCAHTGDGIFVSKSLLLNSGLLTESQKRQVQTMS